MSDPFWDWTYACSTHLHTQCSTRLRRTVEVGVWRIPLDVQRKAMGIDWMDLRELSEAIPPAMTEHLGRQLLAHVREKAAA